MNKHTLFVIFAVTIWIGETIYFGYNEYPKSSIERILDIVSLLFIFWGIVGDIARHIQWHSNQYGQTTVTEGHFYLDGKEINFKTK